MRFFTHTGHKIGFLLGVLLFAKSNLVIIVDTHSHLIHEDYARLSQCHCPTRDKDYK
ncbi:hypothetical protein VHA_000762 [Grimontia hollisae CIP 101886]|uniref:Uncharacterized protein n=1 Tax=Grimontia hollisae CIP 101886 TaxID=675812 RepID=D0I4U7_GRIHO|nr:hypothetical protein VHA_000762 [Grimontia hollisae CIP 101886]